MTAFDYDVYLTFSREDAALGRAIGRYLRASGLRVAVPQAPEETADTPWLAVAERAVARSRKLVVLISEGTPGGWLRAELDFASRQLQLEVIPLVREGFSRAEEYPTLSLFTPMRLPNDRAHLDNRLDRLVKRLSRDGAPLRPPIDRSARPFPGLRPFGLKDGRWFFGRFRELAEATHDLGFGAGQARWLRVEGPAGSGKTSFARAGVADAVLRGAAHEGPSDWFVAAFRPGGHPFQSLANALGDSLAGRVDRGLVEVALGRPGGLVGLLDEHLRPGEGLLLVIDHLDDVAAAWEQGSAGVEAFDGQLAAALAARSCRLMLVTASLSGQARRTLDVLPGLQGAAEEAVVAALGGLPSSALRSVIEQPLAMVGRRWPKALVERLVQDAAQLSGSPGPLCWMLDRLLSDKTPTLAWYEALGGLRHGPGRALDDRLAVLDDEAREATLTLLLSLIGAGRGRADQLLGLPLDEAAAIAGGGRRGEELVRSLTRPAGQSAPDLLLRLDPDGARVRLAHADLLRVWPRIRGLLASHRAVIERRADIERAAAAWHDGGRNPAQLPEGPWLLRDIGADLVPGDRRRLKAILGRVSRAYVEAAEGAEGARKAAESIAQAQEKAAVEAERVAERAAAASREARLTTWRSALGAATAVLLVLLVVQAMLAGSTRSDLEAVAAERDTLTRALAERDRQVSHLEGIRDGLSAEKASLTTGLRRAQAVAQTAATEAAELLEHAYEAARSVDTEFARWTDNAGLYTRRRYFTQLVERVAGKVAASPDNDRQRLLLARLQTLLGKVTSTTGPLRAGPGHFADAVTTLQPLASRAQPAPPFLLALAEAHRASADFHAKVRTAGARYMDFEEAVAQMEKAVAAWDRLVELYPQHPVHHSGLVEALDRLSWLRLRANQFSEAKDALRRALTVARRLATAAPQDYDRAFAAARLAGDVAELEARTNNPEGARAGYDEALALLGAAERVGGEARAKAIRAVGDRLRFKRKQLGD